MWESMRVAKLPRLSAKRDCLLILQPRLRSGLSEQIMHFQQPFQLRLCLHISGRRPAMFHVLNKILPGKHPFRQMFNLVHRPVLLTVPTRQSPRMLKMHQWVLSSDGQWNGLVHVDPLDDDWMRKDQSEPKLLFCVQFLLREELKNCSLLEEHCKLPTNLRVLHSKHSSLLWLQMLLWVRIWVWHQTMRQNPLQRYQLSHDTIPIHRLFLFIMSLGYDPERSLEWLWLELFDCGMHYLRC